VAKRFFSNTKKKKKRKVTSSSLMHLSVRRQCRALRTRSTHIAGDCTKNIWWPRLVSGLDNSTRAPHRADRARPGGCTPPCTSSTCCRALLLE
jgi:hypothetical protein